MRPLRVAKFFLKGKICGGLGGGFWWRFESALVAFRECFGGVSRVVWWRFEDGLMAFGKCSADNSSVFVV